MSRMKEAAMVAVLAISLQGLLRGQGDQQDQNVSLSLTESFASRYVKSTGSPIGTGPVQQFQADLNLGKYVTITGWQDYDISRRALDEVDVDLTPHKSLCTIRNHYLKGGIAGSVSMQDWIYPSKLISTKSDYAIISTLTYGGPLTIRFTEKHLVTGGWTWDRNNYVFDISKPFKIRNWGRSKLVAGPIFRTAYDDNFFKFYGWNIATPGVSARFSRRGLSIDAFAKKEFRMDVPPAKKGFYYEGISVTFAGLPWRGVPKQSQ